MARIALKASLCAAAIALASAMSASAETLEDALALAYQSNPTLLAERARQRATDESYIQARSAALPSVSASASTAVTDSRSATPVSNFGSTGGGTFTNSDTTGSNTYSVTADQSLYRGGSTRAAMSGALSSIEAGRARLDSVEQQILLDAVSAYVDVRRDEEIVTIRANNVDVLRRQLQAARDRFEVGEITRTDVAQAEARLAGAQSQLSAAEAALIASRSAYERVVGQAPGTLAPTPELPDMPSNFQEALDEALDLNPDIRAARHDENAARAAAREAAGALLPSVSARVTASRNEGYLTGAGDRDSVTGSATLSVPLFAGGLNSSRTRAARATASQARLQMRQIERNVREAVANAWSGYDSARAQIVSTSEQVRANEIAFEGVEEEARVGLRTTLDVLDAEQELLNARLTLVQAERDAYVAAFRLLQAVGRLTAEELGLGVEGYDPGVNLSEIRRRYIGVGVLELR